MAQTKAAVYTTNELLKCDRGLKERDGLWKRRTRGFSLNRRLLRALRRRARGEGGVTLVEMMVSLFTFAIVSTMFTVSIVQYLHSTTADAIRTRSATEIATSVQALDRYVRNAEGVEEAASGDRLTLVTTDADGIRQCAVIEYTEATWSGGRVDDYGSVVVKTRPYATVRGERGASMRC